MKSITNEKEEIIKNFILHPLTCQNRIWSLLLKKSLTENFIFCSVSIKCLNVVKQCREQN